MMRISQFLLVLSCAIQLAVADDLVDIRSVEPDLIVPELVGGEPRAGARVKQTIPQYRATRVYHVLYLPADWQPHKRYPVIVEFAGNGLFKNKIGDVSTGLVEGSKLGYGISGGQRFIWLCLPYLNNAGTDNVITWWGERPEYRAGPTVDYTQKAVTWICDQYGGDPDAVILAGFSRGAIACNFIGLHNDEIAKLWRAFIPYSHYDGVNEQWGYPGADRKSALQRLGRLAGRPQFICHEVTAGARLSLDAAHEYLKSTGIEASWTFVSTGFRNHNDAWVLRPSAARDELRRWLDDVLTARK